MPTPDPTGPPPPDYGPEGENKGEREPPGGYLGEKKGTGGVITGPGPVIPSNAPDPVEPNYSDDKWELIHYAASRANYYPSEMRNRIQTEDINALASETKWTPLHIGAKCGQSEAVTQLIAAKARIDVEDVLGQTALSLACCFDVGVDIPSRLLDAGADKERVDKYSWRPIFWAAKKGYRDVVKLLLDRGATKHPKDKRGQTPFDVASDTQTKALLQ